MSLAGCPGHSPSFPSYFCLGGSLSTGFQLEFSSWETPAGNEQEDNEIEVFISPGLPLQVNTACPFIAHTLQSGTLSHGVATVTFSFNLLSPLQILLVSLNNAHNVLKSVALNSSQ